MELHASKGQLLNPAHVDYRAALRDARVPLSRRQQLVHCPNIRRRREVEALAELAVQGSQTRELFEAFNTFGDHRQLERLRKFDDRCRQLVSVVLVARPIDEGLVDFQNVEGKLPEVAQGGIACAKVVDWTTLSLVTFWFVVAIVVIWRRLPD